jgi:hypothetical protein
MGFAGESELITEREGWLGYRTLERAEGLNHGEHDVSIIEIPEEHIRICAFGRLRWGPQYLLDRISVLVQLLVL